MNSTQIQNEITQLFGNYDYSLLNSFIFGWESDYFCISKSGYAVEVEIKISKSDFKCDFKKTTAHRENKHEYLTDSEKLIKPNRFFFACPEGLIGLSDIPDSYGLIWVKEQITPQGIYRNSVIIRDAKFLHKTKILENKKLLRRLMDKFYYRNIRLMQINRLRDIDLRYKQTRIEFY